MKKEKLHEALWFAVSAHAGQFDKAGFPYVLHPIRVSEAVESDDEKIVALLHDVVEDTDATLAQVYDRFGGRIANAVAAITKREKSGGSETYREYLDRIREEPIGRQVRQGPSLPADGRVVR
jgi:(p)ppGpp synthase/HD superfamily hydrolase